MTPYYQDDQVTLHHGDCLEVMASLPAESVHAIVTDPPYGLEFMGREWDGADGFRRSLNAADAGRDNAFGRASRTSPEYRAGTTFQEWCERWAAECLRVLKPGGHMLAFGGSRTWHRLAVAVEDAGFEIRDSIAWLHAQGFPKSLDVSKAIDKDNGRKFEDRFALGRHIRERREALGLTTAEVNGWFGYRDGCQHWERQDRSGARVPTLADWHILRERLDLSDEHLPLVERVEAEREVIGQAAWTNSANHFIPGGDHATRVHLDITAPATPDAERWQGWGTALKPAFEPIVVARKPLTGTVASNVLAHGTGALNIDASRISTDEDRSRPPRTPNAILGNGKGTNLTASESNPAGRWPTNVLLDDTQSAELDRQSGESLSPKPYVTGGTFKDDGEIYGKGIGDVPRHDNEYGDSGGASRFFPTFRYEAKAPTSERPRHGEVAHPTVKPLGLMRWLVRLVTPPGGTVLDPFAGSGTTAEACVIEGFPCIVIEREADYLPLIKARLTKPLEPVLDLGALS